MGAWLLLAPVRPALVSRVRSRTLREQRVGENWLYPTGGRLLLGLKGTMSEAELHVLEARMLAGLFI
jgi:hypothetical protein